MFIVSMRMLHLFIVLLCVFVQLFDDLTSKLVFEAPFSFFIFVYVGKVL